MPSSNHVIVLQDLGSRYPAAKLVSSAKAEKVIPALKEIYSYYGNPEIQISDNGPPFSSKKMGAFANENNIKLQKIVPTTSIIKFCRDFYVTPSKNNENSSYEQKLRKRDSEPVTKQLQGHPSPCNRLTSCSNVI